MCSIDAGPAKPAIALAFDMAPIPRRSITRASLGEQMNVIRTAHARLPRWRAFFALPLWIFLISIAHAGTPPAVFMTFSPDVIATGGTSTLTITLLNPAAVASTLTIIFIDVLPFNVVPANSPNIGGTCTTSSISTNNGNVIYANGSSIPPGGCTIKIDVTTNVPGNYTDIFPAGDLQTTLGNNQNAAAASLRVLSPPTVSKNFSPNSILAGEPSTLTIAFGNSNNGIFLASSFVDTLPASLVIAGAPNIGGTCPGAATATPGSSTLTMTSGSTIPAGGCTISADVTASVAGDFINTIFAGDLQTNSGSNASPATAMLHVSAVSSTTLSTVCETTFVVSQPFSTTAAVAGANPGGDATFLDGGIPIGGCTSVALSAGVASCSTSSLAIGMHQLTSAYGGDANNSSSNSASLFVTVLDAADTIMRNGFEETIAGCPVM